MESAIAGLVTPAGHALGAVVSASAHAGTGWLALGLGLHLANQLARGRGWSAVVNAAAGAEPVPRRHVVGAWIAGAGVAGVVTARLGDLLRVVLLSGVAPRVGRARLAGTLVAEAVGDVSIGSAVTAVAVLLGVGSGLGHGGILVAAAVAAVGGAILAGRGRRRRRAGRRRPAPRIVAKIGDGLAALRAPRAYARDVLSWQLASRGLRFASLACFLAAFGLPVTVQSVLLVVFAQSAGNAIPFSPAAVAAGAATLAATFAPLTHAAASSGRIAAFYLSTIGLLTLTGVLSAAAISVGLTASARRMQRRSQPKSNLPLTVVPGEPLMLTPWSSPRSATAPSSG